MPAAATAIADAHRRGRVTRFDRGFRSAVPGRRGDPGCARREVAREGSGYPGAVMRLVRACSAAAALVLGATVPAQAPSPEVGIGLFPFLVGNMDGRVREVVDKVVAEDADLIYVSVFRTTGPSDGDLWVTDHQRTWNPAWGSVRPGGAGIDLRELIRYAHSRDVRVVGVIKCFDDSVQPTDAGHRQYLLDVIGWLMDQADSSTGRPVYDLDGIALDYVRFVGGSSNGQHQLVTNFVRDVKRRIGALTLHAYLIASRFYIDGPPYDGNFRSYGQAMQLLRNDYGQDWAGLAAHLDVMMPMCYTADGSIYSSYALHQAYVRQCASFAITARTSAQAPDMHVQPVVKTYSSSGETTTPQTVEASITGALLGGAEGYQTFRYATTDASWWPKVRQYAVPGQNWPQAELASIFQGLTANLDPTASRDFDQPASTLSMRYDLDDDGGFETGWSPNATRPALLPRPGPQWVGLRVRDVDGNIGATRRRFDVPRPLGTPSGTIRASQPVQLDFDVHAGPLAASHTYMVLASLAGSSPGTPWQPGFNIPLNIDSFSEAMLSVANTAVFPGAIGVLDGQGRSSASLVLPAGVLTPLAFRFVTFSVIGVDLASQPAFVGNALTLVVLP